MKNRLKQIRIQRKLSQRKLADAVGTSQQQIQRIETGKIAARLDIANRLSVVLGEPLNAIFPGSGKVIKKLDTEFKTSRYIPTKTYSELSNLGIEADSAIWHFKILLRGHEDELIFEISPAERRRMFGAVQQEGEALSFVVFDTSDARIAVNLAEMVYCHFLFDVGVISEKSEEGEDSGVEIYFSGSPKRFDFEPEVDRADPEEEGDEGDFGNIFWSLDLDPASHERYRFTDVDGEDVFLRAGDLALLKVPLWVVEPDLLDTDEDEEDQKDQEGESAEMPAE